MRKWKNTFVVGLYKCEMTFKEGGGITAKWDPDLPPAKSLNEQEMRQYKAGRNALLAEVGKALGGSVLVIE